MRTIFGDYHLGNPFNPLASQVSKLQPPSFVSRTTIPGGKKGTAETLKLMRKWWVNDAPYLRKFTGKLLAGGIDGSRCAVKDFVCDAEHIYDFVKKNIRWTPDIYQKETLMRPVGTLEAGFGDCDCLTMLLNSFYHSVGFETAAVAGDLMDDSREFSHVWSRVNVPGVGWVSVDPSDPKTKFGWESDKGTKRLGIIVSGEMFEERL